MYLCLMQSTCLELDRLKESLAEALTTRDSNAGRIPKFDADSPAEATIKVLDRILHGEPVSHEQDKVASNSVTQMHLRQ